MAERKLKCSVCGKEYTTTAPNSKYCGFECREIGRIQHREAWKNKPQNEDYYTIYGRLYKRARTGG